MPRQKPATPSTTTIPQRTDQHAAAPEGVTRITSIEHEFLEAPVVVPEPNERWHYIAKGFYESVRRSGESVLFEPSDWALLYLTCESLSRDLRPQFVGMAGEVGAQEPHHEVVPLRGASLTAYMRVFAVLGIAEGDRRRMRVEVMRGPEHTGLAEVVDISHSREEALKRRDVG